MHGPRTSSPAIDSDVARLRAQNGRRFLTYVRPSVALLGLALALLSRALAPNEQSTSDFVVIGASLTVAAAGVLAVRRFPVLPVVNATLVFDIALLYLFVRWSEYPEVMIMTLLWPIIALSYFVGPRTALVATVLTTMSCFWLQATDPHWTDERVISGASYTIFIAGVLVWFVAREGRRVEHTLALARARSHRQLAVARRIRMTTDPQAALAELAREVGLVTRAERVAALLQPSEGEHRAQLVEWNRAADPAISVRSILVAQSIIELGSSGSGILSDEAGGALSVHAPFDALTEQATARAPDPGGQNLEDALQDTFDVDPSAAPLALVPLMVGARCVGLLHVVGPDKEGWSQETALLLAELAPQVATGIAQVVVVQDQRDALTSMERLDAMRDRLIASVSHELRTPLTSTIGFIETLLRDDLDLSPDTRRALMLHARDGGQRLLSLVEDLLTLGTTRPESLDLKPSPQRIRDLVDAAVIGIELPPDRSLVLRIDEDVEAVVDRNRVLQVITNLVVNAVRHGAGDVEVWSRRDGDFVHIDVIDSGSGVPEEHERELFVPFAAFSRHTDSTGLGLAICRTIVNAHGGTISYARIEQSRTRFRVALRETRDQ